MTLVNLSITLAASVVLTDIIPSEDDNQPIIPTISSPHNSAATQGPHIIPNDNYVPASPVPLTHDPPPILPHDKTK